MYVFRVFVTYLRTHLKISTREIIPRKHFLFLKLMQQIIRIYKTKIYFCIYQTLWNVLYSFIFLAIFCKHNIFDNSDADKRIEELDFQYLYSSPDELKSVCTQKLIWFHFFIYRNHSFSRYIHQHS